VRNAVIIASYQLFYDAMSLNERTSQQSIDLHSILHRENEAGRRGMKGEREVLN